MLQADGRAANPRAVPLADQALSTRILELLSAAAQLGQVKKGTHDST